MSKITYLLGAGASCGSLPLANQLGNRMGEAFEHFRKDIEKLYGTPGMPYPENYRPYPRGKYAKNYLESLKWLAEYSQKHSTVDALARKLWIRQDNEAIKMLHRLKSVISCYFLYEHSKSDSDQRYDNFFASVLERGKAGKPIFPGSISIITWNYDLLLEKSYYEFCANEETVWNHITKNENILRLNGRADAVKPVMPSVKKYSEWKNIDLIYKMVGSNNTKRIIDLYDNLSQQSGAEKLMSQIYFAWEVNNIENKIQQICKETQYMVIIGYSFPFFNQDIDRVVLKHIHSTLIKIYLQTNNDEGGKERLLNILSDLSGRRKQDWEKRIEMILGKDYFYIPNVFNK